MFLFVAALKMIAFVFRLWAKASEKFVRLLAAFDYRYHCKNPEIVTVVAAVGCHRTPEFITEENECSDYFYKLHAVSGHTHCLKFLMKVEVERKSLQFKVDKGAAHSLVSEKTYQKVWP